ncbi:aquaporin Z [Acinetobacter baumannii]|uniref:aquaporin Z n=1 Tax=Acinetobacter TaxID=469 RepID=UPI000A6800D4
MNKYFAEFLGTFWLVFGGCGSAVLAAAFPEHWLCRCSPCLWFNRTHRCLCSRAYLRWTFQSRGKCWGGRFDVKDLIPYIVAQVVGATAAAFVLYIIAQGQAGFSGVGGFATNGFGDLSPNKFGLGSAFIIEVVLTAFFLIIILGATDRRAPAGFAPIAIGLGLTLIHLISIPVTNTSVNPARSTGVAFFAETAALSQLWLFWVAPILGAVIGAIIYKVVAGDKD